MAVGSPSGFSTTQVMMSADGVSFQTVVPAKFPEPGYLFDGLKSVLFYNGKFCAGDTQGGYHSSTDGIHWPGSGFSGTAVGTDRVGKIAVIGAGYQGFSLDGGNTFLRSVPPSDPYQRMPRAGVITAVCYGAGQFVGVDAAGWVWTSERGEYWLLRECYAKAGEGFRGVAYNGASRFVAVGSAPTGGAALIAVASIDPPPPAPPGYTIYRLQDVSNGAFTGEPRAITNSGIIGGKITNSEKRVVGAILRDGLVTTYPDPVYTTYPTAVTGVAENGSAALEVSVGQFGHTFGDLLPQNTRTWPAAGIYSSASISSNGMMAGAWYNFDGSQRGIYRFDSNTGTSVDLGNFGVGRIRVNPVNDSGQIAGVENEYFPGGPNISGGLHYRPFRISADGQLTFIPTLGGNFHTGIVMNSSGDIAGAAALPSSPDTVNGTHAFLFHNGGTSDIDLFNSRFSRASGINNKDDVVGDFQAPDGAQNAFLYHNGIMYDLSRLLDASGDGWVLYRATSINDNGWIVGQGYQHRGSLEPFLAIPTAGAPAGIQTRFVNLSTRLRTSTGSDALIAGFILRGGPKRLVLRALGPALRNPGNPAASPPDLLADPILELFNDRGERIAYNDNFTDLPYFPDQNDIGAYGLAPPSVGSSVTPDSVIMAVLPEGSYTAVVRGKDGTSGNCVVEVYNIDTDYSPGLLNISTRGPVGAGDNVMIAGIIIRGDRERRILIRGIGPSLAAAGVANPLRDPTLEIHDANGQIAQNDNWRSDQENAIRAAGFAPGDDRDAGVILSLWPGNYTAIVRGKGSDVGNALVEVYTLSD